MNDNKTDDQNKPPTKKKLFSWFRDKDKDKTEILSEPTEAEELVELEEPAPAEPEQESEPEETELKPVTIGLFKRLTSGLQRTRSNLSNGLANLFLGHKTINDELLEELETRLILADVGVDATREILQSLAEKVARKELTNTQSLAIALRKALAELLEKVEQPLVIPMQDSPYVILMVGVNGVGKTTTIGKIASKLKAEGRSVMLAAGDTFRAAAVEQLQVWGERNDIPVVAQHTGADSASVIYDALESAKAKKIDVLIADTAGRLHTRENLMEELVKVKRVLSKLDNAAPHEVMLVLDAGTGQNAINQAEQFNKSVSVTGLALTKLDGTAKGGVIFAIAKKLEIPVRFIGIGETIDDLRVFNSDDFIAALFSEDETNDSI